MAADTDPPSAAKPAALFAGRVALRQPERGHRVGTDAVLLAACLAEPGPRVIDAGAGIGAVGLSVAARSPSSSVTLIERDGALAALARANADANGFGDRVQTATCDLLDARARGEAALANGAASAVFTNPPFYPPDRVRASPDPARAAAHVLGEGGLQAWLHACFALLAPGGGFVMIHRADALADILEACPGRLGGLRILPVHARAGEAATRLLVSGRKGSRAALALLPALTLHEADGRFTPRAAALHAGAALLEEL